MFAPGLETYLGEKYLQSLFKAGRDGGDFDDRYSFMGSRRGHLLTYDEIPESPEAGIQRMFVMGFRHRSWDSFSRTEINLKEKTVSA